jgi:hypothetical protein
LEKGFFQLQLRGCIEHLEQQRQAYLSRKLIKRKVKFRSGQTSNPSGLIL